MSKLYNENELNKAINSFIKTINFDTSDFGTNKDLGISIGSISFVYSSSKLEDIKYIIEKNDNFKGVNFKEGFENKLISYISSGLTDKINNKSKIEFKNIKQKENFFKDLINKFFNAKLQFFYCLLPVYGFSFSEDHINLEVIDFYKFNQKQKVVDEILNEKVEFKIPNYILPNRLPFAKIKVKALYIETATQLGKNVVQGILNAYQLVSCNFTYDDKMVSVINASKSYSPSSITVSSNSKSLIGSPEKYYIPFEFNDIQKIMKNKNNNSEKLKSKYIQKIYDIAKKLLNNEQLTPFEQNIWISNRLMAEGIQAYNYQDKITKLMSSLESLLETNGKGLSLKLRKTVIILYCNLENQNIIKKFNDIFKELYKIRSNIAHGENINVTKRDIDLLFHICISIILIMVNNFNKYNKERGKNKKILKHEINSKYNKLILKYPSIKDYIQPKKYKKESKTY